MNGNKEFLKNIHNSHLMFQVFLNTLHDISAGFLERIENNALSIHWNLQKCTETVCELTMQ